MGRAVPADDLPGAFDLKSALAETDKALKLPDGLSAAQIQIESGGNPRAKSKAGAMGLAQVMPQTLAVISKRLGRELDPYNEQDAVEIHREVMRENLGKFKDPSKALMAYNGGWDESKWGNSETAAYVGKINAQRNKQTPIVKAADKVLSVVSGTANAASRAVPADDLPDMPAVAKTNDASDSSIVALGAGLGKGFGNVALNVQKYAGKGLEKLGADSAGQWLQKDADQGIAKIKGELAPYAAKSPIAAGAGELGGEIIATAPVGGFLGKGVATLAKAGGPAVVNAVQPFVNALTTGGFRAGTPGVAAAGSSALQRATAAAPNMLTRAAGGAITGGAAAGLVNSDDAATGAIIGGALPTVFGAIGKAGQKIGQSIRGGELSPEVAALAKRANDLGINIPADRLVDSKPLNALASSLNYVPFSGRAGVETKMQSQLNKALTRTFGQDSDNVTGALRKAGDALGTKFDDVLQNTTVKVDDEFLTALSGAEAKAASELGSDGERIIRNQINEILAKAGRKAPAPGVRITQNGDFVSAISDAGQVGGHVRGGALYINTAEVADALRGKGHGLALYQSIIDDAHAKGLRVFSDKAVERSAVNVYDSLGRRGYEIKKLGGTLDDGAAFGSKDGPAFEVVSKAFNEIDGQAAYNIKKTLDRIGKRNSPEAYYAIDLKNDLMGALNRSLGPTEAAAFKTTRQQYGNMMALEKLAKNGVDGDISIGRLANLKNIGNNDLQELADIAAQFLKTREAPHGAAQRVGAAGLATYLGGPGALAAGVVGGRGANMLLNSNAAKNFVMPAKNLANSAPTNSLLGAGFYRAAPLLGGDR